MSEFNVGDEVMMIDKESHEYCPKKFPAKGSIGVVVRCMSSGEVVLVDWGQDSGVGWNISEDEYAWWCTAKKLEKVNANTQVNTQKEVCNMNKFNVGDKVVFTNGDKHERMSRFYPAVGSIGIVRDRDKNDDGVLIDWDEAEGVYTNGNYAAKAWWCEEEDIKLCEYTDDEVWEMLKPKMRQFVRTESDIYLHSPTVKNMVVAAYRSGYGRATKGRSFIIKSREVKNPFNKAIEHLIETLLNDKMVVTFYAEDNSYTVSEFDHALHSEQGMEIHGDTFYGSDGEMRIDGFDVIGDPDCEMYVAIPFSEAIGQFDGKSIKAMYCGDKAKIPNSIKPWSIGKYHSSMRFFCGKTYVFMEFENENGKSQFFPESICSDFKALVPIYDYLRVNGVNV